MSTTLAPAPVAPALDMPAPHEGGELDLSGYDPQAYNILSPVLKLDTAAPYLRFRAVEVRLDPDTNRGDCYVAPGAKWIRSRITGQSLPTHVAPAKPGLLKIASAAGLVIDPQNSHRIKPDACERCIDMARATGNSVRCGDCLSRCDTAYQYIGAVRTDTGWRIVKSSYEWNLDAQRRKIVREGKKKQAKAEEERKPFDLDDYVDDRMDQVTSERYGLAETKALLRLVRAICHLRQAYLREEMERPFVVVRTELAPDFADPAVRQALANKALMSGAEIFGPAREETPVAVLHNVAADAQVLEELASHPDFADAETRAEVVGPKDGEAAPVTYPIGTVDEQAPYVVGASEAQDPPAGPDEAPQPTPAAAPAPDSDAIHCDDCGASLLPNVVAFCQSARGRQAFGGANLCFACQNKRRPKTAAPRAARKGTATAAKGGAN